MTLPTVLILVAILFALIEEFQSNGRSFVGWAVVFIGVALLWGRTF